MEFKWQALYDRKRHCSGLIWPQGAKCKFWILTAHLQDMPNHILEYQVSTPENVDALPVTNFSIFDPHLNPREKIEILKPYWTFTRHFQLILEYHLSILWNIEFQWQQLYKNVIFCSGLTPEAKMKTFKPFAHLQVMSNQILENHLATT